MGVFLTLCLGWTLQLAQAVPGGSGAGYTQSYVIRIQGTMAGNESVVEKTDENGDLVATSKHDLVLNDGLEAKRMAFETRLVLSKGTLAPKSYSYRYADGISGDSYEVTVQDGQATRTLNRGGISSVVTAPVGPDTVILDFSVYHQYDYVIRKYDMKAGGRQLFSDFVPLVGSDIPLAVTFQGEGSLEAAGQPVPVRNFQIEFVGIWTGYLSADKDGRLVRLALPAQNLEVLRKDLLPQ